VHTRSQIIDELLQPGLIAVVRARRPEQVPPLAEALLAGGIRAIEITLTTPDAFAAIRSTCAALGNRGLVGVGTVLTEAECEAALEAGARFVVTPVLRPRLVPLAHRAGRPIMLGAFTPTEAQAAHEAGADFVKLFPADTLGPGFIRALRAPLPHLRIVPTGGVDLHNAAEFLRAGCAALGIGSSLLRPGILENEDWESLTALARQFVAAVQPD